jgi:glycosyltransferase involved in cell wall biosynthesis
VEHIARHKHTELFFSSPEDKFFWHKLAEVTYHAVNSIVGVSKGVNQSLIDSYGVSNESLRTIYNGIGGNKAGHIEVHRSRKFILNIGRLLPQKQQDHLLKAYAESGICKDYDLVILGEGPDLESLEQLADKLHVRKYVFFEGFCENVSAYLDKASCFVFSSAYEGFGIVLVEALANGCPVVSYDCDYGPAEIVQSPNHGVLVPVDRIDLLADAILKTVSSEPRSPQSDAERIAYAKTFSIPRMVEGYEQCFESALQG